MRMLTAMLMLFLPVASSAIVSRWDSNRAAAPVRSITTTIRYANGDEQRNEGSGFVVGNRFYTAYHNIQPVSAEVERRDILIGGIAVEPVAVDIVHDLAVFDVPRALCASWCNSLEFLVRSPESVARVAWLRPEGDRRIWEQGQVNNLAVKSERAGSGPLGCDENLIVEVDRPFVPGSSGGPVFDATTGTIVGLIQGSFQSRSGAVTGYYKPVQCVVSRLEKRASPRTELIIRGTE